jgi:hypothetical protein
VTHIWSRSRCQAELRWNVLSLRERAVAMVGREPAGGGASAQPCPLDRVRQNEIGQILEHLDGRRAAACPQQVDGCGIDRCSAGRIGSGQAPVPPSADRSCRAVIRPYGRCAGNDSLILVLSSSSVLRFSLRRDGSWRTGAWYLTRAAVPADEARRTGRAR